MGALLDHGTGMEDCDLVAEFAGGEPVADVDGGFVAGDLVELGVSFCLCDGVQRRCRLVQDDEGPMFICSRSCAVFPKDRANKDIVFKIVRITAAIWQTHPFREGNTHSVVAFSVLLAAKLGVELDYDLCAQHASYVRNALVRCTQGIYSIYDYLEQIYFDAAGLLDELPEQTAANQKNYDLIEGYRVSDYKEHPHTYAEEADD